MRLSGLRRIPDCEGEGPHPGSDVRRARALHAVVTHDRGEFGLPLSVLRKPESEGRLEYYPIACVLEMAFSSGWLRHPSGRSLQ